MKINAILFDHDGTLVDSEFAHFEMWRDILRKYGIELSHQKYNGQDHKNRPVRLVKNLIRPCTTSNPTIAADGKEFAIIKKMFIILSA